MAKRPSLATAKITPDAKAALHALQEPQPVQPVTVEPAPPKKVAEKAKAPTPAKPFRAATREGLKKVTVGLTPEQHAELKILSARKSVHGRVTIEDLLRDAVVKLLARAS